MTTGFVGAVGMVFAFEVFTVQVVRAWWCQRRGR